MSKRRILEIILFIMLPTILFGAYVLGCLVFGTINEYQPKNIEVIAENPPKVITDSVFNFTIWNIGYAGLGASNDFFYDGGKMVRPEKSYHDYCFKKITEFVQADSVTDFWLFQEVDVASKRSYFTNHAKTLSSLAQSSTSFALNYQVNYIPMPITNPMMGVKSGLLTTSGYEPYQAKRIDLKSRYDWPQRLFFLKRCLLETRYPLGDRDLVIYNIHLSAYDNGNLKAQELSILDSILKVEQQLGNYVIIGGDWNIDPNELKDCGKQIQSFFEFYEDEWQLVYDDSIPSNRSLAAPYEKGVTNTARLDYYLISPNLNIERIHTFDMDFMYSDHQPVALQVKLSN